MMTKWMRKNLWKKTDVCLACSKLAGKAVFGEKAWAQGAVHVVPNAIEVDKFSYNDQMRAQMRQKLELGNCLTVGHVGRFNEMKNHLFLLEVFAQIKRSRPDAQLILLGEGGGMEPAKQKAAELGIMQKAFSSSEIRGIRRIIIRRWICLFSRLCMRDCPERCWKHRLQGSRA
ncbi:glycosyltransferase [Gallintestinimicrobium sp.]|uniref:glycosyltransferase n=1 Tax=Gallintestinimicrobium sp. TaxID=2981655 RepID=UPI0039961236